MVKVVGVRFRTAGRVYTFDATDFELKSGQKVIVETARGVEFGTVVGECKEMNPEDVVQPLKPIIRIANPRDYEQEERNRKKEEDAFNICLERIKSHGLEMKLINAEYTFDNNKVLFYFTADGRVDFRELVKDLASVFKTRIELRQIGAREVAKMLGGIGLCGREFCCRKYTTDFVGVTVNMAKLQSISLNPVKISGTCGRLMCCLSHENDAYKEYAKITPNVGSYVQYGNEKNEKGTVTDSNLITGKLRIQPDEEKGTPIYVERSKVKVIKEGHVKENIKEEKEIKELLEKN
jgi:cell fate regulator YaaT (PSP1 superfamily)